VWSRTLNTFVLFDPSLMLPKTLTRILLFYAFEVVNALTIDAFQVTRSVPLTLTWNRNSQDPDDGWFFRKSDVEGSSNPLVISRPGDSIGQLPITFTNPG
jgi:hypothetical protein